MYYITETGKIFARSSNKNYCKKCFIWIIKSNQTNIPICWPWLPWFTFENSKKNKFQKVRFGNNVLIGKNVKIGTNTFIGPNSIIESNVQIGKNCVFGSGVIIKNSIIKDNVVIQDNSKIGQKGFGFIPKNGKNLKFPHIGKVVIFNNVEILQVAQ